MENRSDHIRSRGAEYFDQITTDREEETLHLEFKTLSHAGGQLKRDDRKMIAEAVAGLANAEGGVLVVGIETQRLEGIDVAVAKRAIKELARTTNLVRAAIPEMLSPQHTGITAFSVSEDGKDDEGFIVIDVPASSERPHYSNVHHQYFRRGSDRTRVLEHGEIRDLMFAVRHGELDIKMSMQSNISSANRIGFSFILSLLNVGRAPVRAPYLKISPAGWGPVSNTLLEERNLRGNTRGFYAKTDQLVHVEDEFNIASRVTGIEFRLPIGGNETLISKVREAKNADLFFIKPFTVQGWTDQLFGPFQVLFGAENAMPKTAKFDLGKWDMFEIMARNIMGEG